MGVRVRRALGFYRLICKRGVRGGGGERVRGPADGTGCLFHPLALSPSHTIHATDFGAPTPSPSSGGTSRSVACASTSVREGTAPIGRSALRKTSSSASVIATSTG